MASPDVSDVLRTGPIELRPTEFTAMVAGQVLSLSHRELQLLEALMRKHGRIVARAQLFEAVWGRDLPPGDRSVDVYVHRLRGKLERALPGWVFIHTHFGFGYRLSPEQSRDVNARVTDP
jgi:DNA-binding response OmpR family regulator